MSKHDSSDSFRDGRWDYEGLQVDTRAMDNAEKHLDPLKSHQIKRPRESNEVYLNEKEIRIDEDGQESPTSPGSAMDSTMTSTVMSSMGGATTMIPETPMTPAKVKMMDDEVPQPPEPKPRQICGLRRRIFWIVFVIGLGFIILAAVVGGVVGGMKRSSSSAPAPSAAPAAPPAVSVAPTVNGPLLSQDVIADSPVNVISYVKTGDGNPLSKQTFSMYYQSAIGNVKEAISDQFGQWQAPTPILTDAVNNTGLASIVYTNGTGPQASLFYIDEKLNVQEKRKLFSDSHDWEQRNLNSQLHLTVRGNSTAPNNDDQDPINDWDGFRMAAVYSPIFQAGPQARLFLRQQNIDGISLIQELKWDQKHDNWSEGANFTDSWPTSHMTATIDESTNILRLFFSTGNKTLQEYWTDITTPQTVYAKGLSIPNFLPHNNADIAATSFNGTTYLYRALPTSNNTIVETRITGLPSTINKPASVNNQESYNLTHNVVVKPSSVAYSGRAVYQPFTSAKTNVTGLPTKMFVFWADTLRGMNGSKVEGGYGEMNQISRDASDSPWPAQQNSVNNIPLGINNAQPWHPESR